MNVRQVIPRDTIPSVNDPSFADRYPGADEDLVVAVEWADPPRARSAPSSSTKSSTTASTGCPSG